MIEHWVPKPGVASSILARTFFLTFFVVGLFGLGFIEISKLKIRKYLILFNLKYISIFSTQ